MKCPYVLSYFFRDIAAHYAKCPAIKYEDKTYTYQELDQHSSTLATMFLEEGIHRGDVIAIINSKNYISFVLMIACLKLGVIYANIDRDSPKEWVGHIMATCKPRKIYSDDVIHDNINGVYSAAIETTETLLNHIGKMNNNSIFNYPALDGDAIAYIMFTSGSTGKPKGVAITHQNLIHFIHWSVERYSVKPTDIFANVSPMYFDNSVFDFYTALFSGACIAPIKKQIVNNPVQLIEYVNRMNCTIWFSVPSLLIYLMMTKVINNHSFATLRVITFGGEAYPTIELKKLYNLFKDRITFINVYGPTECTCICSSYTLTDKDFQDLSTLPPLGQINPNISYLILDENNQLSHEGELCLFGPNVARGYYNDFERTATAFFHYTGHGYYQAKMYRTGDLIRYQGGLLHFVGRKDNQIKHLGYRIELESIEIAIMQISGVNEVAVIYYRASTAYGKIIAFIATSDETMNADVIRAQLKERLPDYMIPNQCVFHQHLPKNANGKINKTLLKDSLVMPDKHVVF